LIEAAIEGRAAGMVYLNEYLKITGKDPVFCQPGKLALHGAQLVTMLRQHVEEDPSSGAVPFGVVILDVLRTVFPCPSGEKKPTQ
jgi:hypothetical protein